MKIVLGNINSMNFVLDTEGNDIVFSLETSDGKIYPLKNDELLLVINNPAFVFTNPNNKQIIEQYITEKTSSAETTIPQQLNEEELFDIFDEFDEIPVIETNIIPEIQNPPAPELATPVFSIPEAQIPINNEKTLDNVSNDIEKDNLLLLKTTPTKIKKEKDLRKNNSWLKLILTIVFALWITFIVIFGMIGPKNIPNLELNSSIFQTVFDYIKNLFV